VNHCDGNRRGANHDVNHCDGNRHDVNHGVNHDANRDEVEEAVRDDGGDDRHSHQLQRIRIMIMQLQTKRSARDEKISS
jgi:hypothetical protein